ncbi:MAG: serine hydrolase [Gemmatimonadota bacterium]|nr:serine hydrolase [Gemmatimonadota bacterium]
MLRLRGGRWTTLLGLLAPLTACSSGSGPESVAPPPPPAEPRIVEGVNIDRLAELASAIMSGQFPDVHSTLVMRNGRMVFERYYNGSGPDDVHTMQSVTKSFASALIGIAIAEGHIAGVDEAVLDFFPEWKEELSADPRRAAMRLEDVLTMRTGTDYHENGSAAPHWQLNALATGWDRFWIERPMVHDPGTFWQYDSGGAVAVSAFLHQRTGLHADGYADATLFAALDIRQRGWFTNAEGHVHTGGGLSLRADDMIKLGQLYLQGGMWEGAQVIPADWVEVSTRRHYTFSAFAPRVTGYGYYWWLMEPDPSGPGDQEIYAAFGARGQYIFVVPEHDLVVAITGDARNGNDWANPQAFLYTHILPAIEE